MAGFSAFREAFVSAGLDDAGDFSDFDGRRLRYALYWAFYENSAYRDLHRWATSYRHNQALYKYIRGIYNPTYRLGEFWKTHLWGGQLDPEAGAGDEKPSALPIITDTKELRPAIAQLWRWSNWQIKKQTAVLYGSILGDVALQVIDDTDRQKVYMQAVHPGIIKDIELDPWGNVKGYKIEESRSHPDKVETTVTYTETARRDGDAVIYETLLNNAPYAWNGKDAEWEENYGFIPLVMVQHNDVGLDWGWSEIHSGRAKFQEIDDLASKLSDQIRKMVDAPWLFAGVENPNKVVKVKSAPKTLENPEPGRQDIPALYGPVGASAQPLVAPLDIGAATNYIQSLLAELERDYPELQMDIWSAGGNATGRALRVARQRVTTKVLERRANYDDALIRAQSMAVSIGGYRGYKGFSGFDLDSYEKGQLEHSIGERPVFSVDPLDEIETENALWLAAGAAVKAGMPLVSFLKRNGWTKKDISDLEATPEFKARLASLKTAALMAQGMDENDQEGGPAQDQPPPAGDKEPAA